MSLTIIENAEGSVIAVRAKPGAKRSAIVGEHAGALKISLAAPPVDGKANQELISFLAEMLQVRRAQIEILRGESSRQKTVLLRDVSRMQIEKLLDP